MTPVQMNRKQRRVFLSFFRRRKLRHLPSQHFSVEDKLFLGFAYPNNW